VGTRKPDGYGFGQNFKPVIGTGFLMGVNIFHGYGFEIAKPSGFIPVAISSHRNDSFLPRRPLHQGGVESSLISDDEPTMSGEEPPQQEAR
jgi:hypothetical protein